MVRVAKGAAARRARCWRCGKAFQTRTLTVRYCSDACRRGGYAQFGIAGDAAKPDKKAARCRNCGGAFRAPTSLVRYCSDACRKEGSRLRNTGAARQRQAQKPRVSTVKCGACGKAFKTGMRKGEPRAYCSEACRADAMRAYQREYARRRLADPEARALHMKHVRASAARRRARARDDKR